MPSTAAWKTAATTTARALRWAFGGLALRVGCCGAAATGLDSAGACAAARVGALPRQKLTVAAAMNTLE